MVFTNGGFEIKVSKVAGSDTVVSFENIIFDGCADTASLTARISPTRGARLSRSIGGLPDYLSCSFEIELDRWNNAANCDGGYGTCRDARTQAFELGNPRDRQVVQPQVVTKLG